MSGNDKPQNKHEFDEDAVWSEIRPRIYRIYKGELREVGEIPSDYFQDPGEEKNIDVDAMKATLKKLDELLAKRKDEGEDQP